MSSPSLHSHEKDGVPLELERLDTKHEESNIGKPLDTTLTTRTVNEVNEFRS
jgi:hypothetical protein